MKTDPKLTESFVNKLWIKFFLTAVYSTMWVRDHARPEFHKALGVDIGWYDQEVFRKTSTIARQIFPIELDIDHPRWIPALERMNRAFLAMDAAKKKGGVSGKLAAGRPARAQWRPSCPSTPYRPSATTSLRMFGWSHPIDPEPIIRNCNPGGAWGCGGRR